MKNAVFVPALLRGANQIRGWDAGIEEFRNRILFWRKSSAAGCFVVEFILLFEWQRLHVILYAFSWIRCYDANVSDLKRRD